MEREWDVQCRCREFRSMRGNGGNRLQAKPSKGWEAACAIGDMGGGSSDRECGMGPGHTRVSMHVCVYTCPCVYIGEEVGMVSQGCLIWV